MSDSTATVSEAGAAAPSVSVAEGPIPAAPDTTFNLLELTDALIHRTGYAAGFVVVLPVALLFAAVPRGGALIEGLIEGSAAARDKAHAWLR